MEDNDNVLSLNGDTTLTTSDSTHTINGQVNSSIGLLSTAPYYTYPYTTYTSPSPWVSIDKAENGFIIRKGYKTYIAKNPEDVIKYLTEDKKGNK